MYGIMQEREIAFNFSLVSFEKEEDVLNGLLYTANEDTISNNCTNRYNQLMSNLAVSHGVCPSKTTRRSYGV